MNTADSTVAAPAPTPSPSPVPASEAGSDQSEQVGRAARGTALNLAGAIVGAVVSFVTVGLITNVYGQSGAGLFFAATATFTLTANSARLGAESSLTYFVSRFRADGRHRDINRVVTTALTATTGVAVLLGAAGLVLAPRLSGVLTSDAESAATATIMIRILALAVPSFALSQAMFGASRGFATMRPSVLAGQITRPLTQLLLVSLVIVISDSVWPLALASALSSIITVSGIGLWLRRRLRAVRARTADQDDAATATATATGEYWRYTGPRALSDLLSASLERLDLILVALFIGEVGAGLYGASNRLILAGQLMMIATAQSMAPLLSANFLKGRDQDARDVLRTISGWNVTILWPVFISLAFGARTALSVFGSEFATGDSLVVVLSLAFLIIIGLGMGDTLLMMTGDSVASLINHAISLVVMVVTAVVLLPAVGVVGAAWAWALSRITLRALSVARVWRTKGIHAFGPPVLTAIAVTTAAFVPTGIMARMVWGQSVAAVLLHVATGAIVQLALLVRFRRLLQLDQLVAVVARKA